MDHPSTGFSSSRTAAGTGDARTLNVAARAHRVWLRWPRVAAGLLALGPTAPVRGAPFTAVEGQSVTLTVSADGSAPFRYQWRKDGADVLGASDRELRLTGLRASHIGEYSVQVANAVGATVSTIVELDVVPPAGLPLVSAQPQNASVTGGATVSFSVSADGSVTYQWLFNGVEISGATEASLVVQNAAAANAGTYTVRVANAIGAVASAPAMLRVNGSGAPTAVVTAPRLINLSARGFAGLGDNTLIAGVVLRGTDPKDVLIRAVGPTLATLNVAGALADPVLQLMRGSSVVEANDRWSDAARDVVGASDRLGAFPLGGGSEDAALLAALPAGAYTAQVLPGNGQSGIAMVEVYDAGSLARGAPRLVNLATRGWVGDGDQLLIGGFVIRDAPTLVLIRGIGPALIDYGVAAPLTDPQLTLFRGANAIAQNDDWFEGSNGPAVANAAERVGAFDLAVASRDAALLVILAPGVYTAHLRGGNGANGVGMLEVYEIAE